MSSAGLNGPNKATLRTNTGPQDALLFNPAQSPFTYQAPVTASASLCEEIIYMPQQANSVFGTSYSYSLVKQADLVGPCFLDMQLAPLDQTIVGGLPAPQAVQYINNFGIGCIDHVEVLYGAQRIVRIPPEWFYVRFQKYLGNEQYAAWQVLQRMNMTGGDPFLMGGGPVYINLCMPWADDTSQYYPMVAMASELRIVVYLKTLNHVLNWPSNGRVQQVSPYLMNGQSPNLIQHINLRTWCHHLTGKERDSLVANVKSPQGIPYMIDDIQGHYRVHVPVSPTPFNFTIRLTDINAPVTSLFWFLTDPNDNQGTNVNSQYYGDYPFNTTTLLSNQVTEFSCSANGYTLIPQTQTFKNLFLDHVRWWSSGQAGTPVFSRSFSMNPEVPNASYGTINFGQADSPTFTIRFGNGLTNNVAGMVNTSQGAWLTIIADTKNFLQAQGGDFTRTFN